MALCVRPMAAGDIPSMARLAEEGFSNTYHFDWEMNARSLHEAVTAGRASVTVAESGGQVVGYCNLGAWPAGGLDRPDCGIADASAAGRWIGASRGRSVPRGRWPHARLPKKVTGR